MTSGNNIKRRPTQIFLSYSTKDRLVAQVIASHLREVGLPVWFDTWELAPGDSITSRIDELALSSDLILLLLSKKAVQSRWFESELSEVFATELKDRSIAILPIVIDDCEIPSAFAELYSFDLSQDFEQGLARLTKKIQAYPEIDFSQLTPQGFENLVGDLLKALGFFVEKQRKIGNKIIDLIAKYKSHDSFGAEEEHTWFVEVKLYRNERVSVSALQQILNILKSPSSGRERGLVVTDGRMTSVARSFLHESKVKSGYELRVIDRPELISLLLEHPQIIRHYFKSDSA